MSHPFVFRPGTCDEGFFHAITGPVNEYRLPEAFASEDIILDVGTHIGSFCYAALQRGSDHVHGFEAFVENYECASRNLAPFGGRVTVENKAVWRSDRKVEHLRFNELSGVNNAAGHVLGDEGGRPVEVAAFDDVVRRITANGRDRVRLMKIDCEGSEFPILLTSKTLHLIDEIVGEYHNFTTEHDPSHPFYRVAEAAKVEGYSRYNIFTLVTLLEFQGFDVAVEYHPKIPTLAGWFFARRVARPVRLPDRVRWHRDGIKHKVAGLRRAG